jgi:formylmethanofuran dehydrogenase subunit C
MSLALTLKTTPAVPTEAEALSPARLTGLNAADALRLPVVHGNQRAELGDFFSAAPSPDDAFHLHGDLSRIKFIGAGMASGRLAIHGDVGMHLGATMSGGVIEVDGSAGDWVGPEMTGGRIVIRGNAGHLVGSAIRGTDAGIQGGEILVFGKAGNEVGSGMRRGLVAIGGDCGDFAGVNMLAGTVVVFGEMGWRPGAGMKRGTIVGMKPVEPLPTFSLACTYHPVFLRLYLGHLRSLGMPVTDAQLAGQYQRWSGDAIELNRGELLLFQG